MDCNTRVEGHFGAVMQCTNLLSRGLHTAQWKRSTAFFVVCCCPLWIPGRLKRLSCSFNPPLAISRSITNTPRHGMKLNFNLKTFTWSWGEQWQLTLLAPSDDYEEAELHEHRGSLHISAWERDAAAIAADCITEAAANGVNGCWWCWNWLPLKRRPPCCPTCPCPNGHWEGSSDCAGDPRIEGDMQIAIHQ